MDIGRKENATSYFQAAVSAIKLNNFLKGQEYLGRALAGFEQLGDTTGMLDCLRQRAILFNSMGRKDLAIYDLRKCLQIAEENEDVAKEIKNQLLEYNAR